MKYASLEPSSELFVGKSLIENAKEYQAYISTIDDQSQQEQLAQEAIGLLGDPDEILGSEKIILHALGAHVYSNKTSASSMDELLLNGKYFSDVTMKSYFNQLAFVRSNTIASLCLWLSEVKIIRSKSDPEFVGQKIATGVYVPVYAVESIFSS